MQEMTSASTAELARLGELIDSIYQGATDPAHWNTVLPAIADWVGAERGILFTPLTSLANGGYYFSHRLSEATMQLLATRYQQHDIWAIRSVELGLMCDGNVINGDDIVPFEEYSKSILYQELLSKIDSAHLLGGVIFGANSPEIPTAAIALHRGLKQGRFHSHEGERLAILLPHISRAFAVMAKLRAADLRTAASLMALDQMASGVLLFNADGVVTFANRAARRILEEEDGLSLQLRFNDSALGGIIAEDRKAHEALTAAIRSAVSPDLLHTEHFSRAVLVARPSGRQDYVLNFSTLAVHNEFGSGVDAPRAIAFITDSAEPIKLDGELLKKTYGLTPAEIRVAETLVECLTVDETADRLGVSRSTVKTQQQSIYEKTSTNNRAKLMKLLMSLAQVAKLAIVVAINCMPDISGCAVWLSCGQQVL